MDPYKVLDISEIASLEYLKSKLKANKGLSDEDLKDILGGKSESEQREIVLDQLIETNYKLLSEKERALNIVKSKILAQSDKEHGIGREKVQIMQWQMDQKVKEYQKLLKEAYDMISTKEKRESLSVGKSFLARQAKWQPVQTNHVFAIKKLENMKSGFPDYISYAYRWGVRLNNEIQCIMDEKNNRNERVIVTRLGDFQCNRVTFRPSQDNPAGKSVFGTKEEVIGITKIDSKGKIRRNDMMIARLNNTDCTTDKEFFRNIFVADGLIDHANLNNHGFMGSVSKEINKKGELEYFIEYNGICDTELVSVLELAKKVKGIEYKKGEKQQIQSFANIKEHLAQLQEEYVNCLIAKENGETQVSDKGVERYG